MNILSEATSLDIVCKYESNHTTYCKYFLRKPLRERTPLHEYLLEMLDSIHERDPHVHGSLISYHIYKAGSYSLHSFGHRSSGPDMVLFNIPLMSSGVVCEYVKEQVII